MPQVSVDSLHILLGYNGKRFGLLGHGIGYTTRLQLKKGEVLQRDLDKTGFSSSGFYPPDPIITLLIPVLS